MLIAGNFAGITGADDGERRLLQQFHVAGDEQPFRPQGVGHTGEPAREGPIVGKQEANQLFLQDA